MPNISTDYKMLSEQLNGANDQSCVVKHHDYSWVHRNIKILRYKMFQCTIIRRGRKNDVFRSQSCIVDIN